MPNCAAEGCTNSSKKKFKMNSFPRNPLQRNKWIKNIARKNWVPNDHAALCEVHFAPSMWEKTRVDGSRKLKFNAVPTIFGNRIVEEYPVVQIKESNTENINNCNNTKKTENTIFSNNQTLIKILPPINSCNSHQTPIIIPAATILNAQSINFTRALIVNSQGKIINTSSTPTVSGATNIFTSQTKVTNAQSSSVILSKKPNILKNQLKNANSHTPIVIPTISNVLKSQLPTIDSKMNSINLLNTTHVKSTNTQPVLIPITTNIFNSKVQTANSQSTPITNSTIISKTEHINLNSDSTLLKNSINLNVDRFRPKVSNQSISTVKPTGIILNKTQAKKIEDERFEKMDKLLLKQLKLNNALRKKLSFMSYKIQQLIKEQNKDCKEFLKDVFTEDQIKALEMRVTNPKSITAWSHKTMMKAIKLKQECGTRGYEELLNQNMPLPSIRTISRWCTARNLPIP